MRRPDIDTDRFEGCIHLDRDDIDAARHQINFCGKVDSKIAQLPAGEALHQHGFCVCCQFIRPVSIKAVQCQGVPVDTAINDRQWAVQVGNIALHRQHTAIGQHNLALCHRQAAPIAVIGHDHRSGFIVLCTERYRQCQRASHRGHIQINDADITIANRQIHSAGNRAC